MLLNIVSCPGWPPGASSDLGVNSSNATVEKSSFGEAEGLQRLWVCRTLRMYIMVWRHFMELRDSEEGWAGRWGPEARRNRSVWVFVTNLPMSQVCLRVETPRERALDSCLGAGISTNIWSTRPSGPRVKSVELGYETPGEQLCSR